ncbi:transcriptional regulator with XRE-family HTH domain [Paenibacillus castaneae]|uniref:helix-turn-helix domain-containing protein n=1 Tax=Paenibacillus castaneae TaxID=474957 RepID=UPI001B801DDD|nr:helix-turn-helix transcriptional regulator [Paenibacillus castaneae]NIK78975.1 transcriptional regulator with XRE-family HTH domain [Paenibacillus castaneae]
MNMQKIGAFISVLRKNKDFTQAELASNLNVSHQAVSKWERGESLPDIGLLPILANHLDITVDELLNGQPALMPVHSTSILEEAAADFSFAWEANATAPSSEQTSQQPITLEHIVSLAPFLAKETLETMVEGMDGGVNGHALNGLAPFIGRKTLERLVGQMSKDSIDMRQVTGLAPFLGEDVLEQLVDLTAEESIDWEVIQALSPFLGGTALSQLAHKANSNAVPDAANLIGLAPFLDQSDLVILIEQVDKARLLPSHLSALAPFLPAQLLNSLILSFKINAE